jgi:hypothetical protein
MVIQFRNSKRMPGSKKVFNLKTGRRQFCILKHRGKREPRKKFDHGDGDDETSFATGH